MKVLGINDEVTTCDCCGKTNLKKTVVLARETDEVRYGVSCAAKALRRPAGRIKAEAEAAEVLKARPVAYYLLRNETLGVWVGGIEAIRFATVADANARAVRGGFVGTARPVYA